MKVLHFCLIGATAAARILFLTNSERGQANIHLATAQALPEHELHFASFPAIESAVADLAKVRPITFHAINEISYLEVLERANITTLTARHPPGIPGLSQWHKFFNIGFMPWSNAEYMAIYIAVQKILVDVNPTLIVAESFFHPGIDAVKAAETPYVLLSPIPLKDSFLGRQSITKMLWHIPTLGSGIPYPMPWRRVPENAYLVWQLIWKVLRNPRPNELTSYLASHGITSKLEWANLCPEDVSCLVSSSQEIEYPLSLPDNVVQCGPISLSNGVIDQDLKIWLEQAPTILIVLGSHTKYALDDIHAMMEALKIVFEEEPTVQVLWKIQPIHPLDEHTLTELNTLQKSGRLRIERWLQSSPTKILESGQIICYINHAGANSFGEGLSSGVPQVLLPMWFDCYDNAVRAEWLGIGVWGNRDSAPRWGGKELSDAILKTISSPRNENEYQKKAILLATSSKEKSGAVVAANHIMQVLKDVENGVYRSKRRKATGSDEL